VTSGSASSSPGPLGQGQASRRRPHAVPGPFEQRDPGFALERPDLPGNGGLDPSGENALASVVRQCFKRRHGLEIPYGQR